MEDIRKGETSWKVMAVFLTILQPPRWESGVDLEKGNACVLCEKWGHAGELFHIMQENFMQEGLGE